MASERIPYTEEAVQKITAALGVPAEKRDLKVVPMEFVLKITNKKLKEITYVGLTTEKREVVVGIGRQNKRTLSTLDYHHLIFENIETVYFYPTPGKGKDVIAVVFENKDHKHLKIEQDGRVFFGTIYNLDD